MTGKATSRKAAARAATLEAASQPTPAEILASLAGLAAGLQALTGVVQNMQAAPPTVTTDAEPIVPDGTPNPRDEYDEEIRTTAADLERNLASAALTPEERLLYPEHKIDEKTGKPVRKRKPDGTLGEPEVIKVGPKDRRHFMRKLASTGTAFEVIVRQITPQGPGKAPATSEQTICRLDGKRFSTGNHGLMGDGPKLGVMFDDGSMFTLGGNVLLQLQSCQRQRQDIR